jgi:hypothetical protein
MNLLERSERTSRRLVIFRKRDGEEISITMNFLAAISLGYLDNNLIEYLTDSDESIRVFAKARAATLTGIKTDLLDLLTCEERVCTEIGRVTIKTYDIKSYCFTE